MWTPAGTPINLIVRGDQYFGQNQKFLVWGKFTWKNFPISQPEVTAGSLALNNSQNRAFKVDTNWTIKPNLINEGGFGFTRYTRAQTTASTAKHGPRRRGGRACRTCSITAFRRWISITFGA